VSVSLCASLRWDSSVLGPLVSVEPGEDSANVPMTGQALVMPERSRLLPFLPDEAEALVQRLSPSALAYLGDAVYELYVRATYLVPPKRLQDYHLQVVSRVRAESQAMYLELLEPHLTDHEQNILRQGRNAVNQKPKRVKLKIYQQATSLETLLGYLYITDPQRLFQLLGQINLELPIDSAQV
jgi:ribonuclease III family protein